MSCITLLSDFGLQDASAAAAKGIMMQHNQDAQIVDISHLIEPFHLQQAAYILAASYIHFPKGTCHVLLFDVFSEQLPKLVLCEHDGHYFLAPDNGLLPLAFGKDYHHVWLYHELQRPYIFKEWVHAAAKACSELAKVRPEALSLPAYELKNAPQHCRPKIDGDFAECQVIHIDRFGNVVINITKEEFDLACKDRPFRIQFMRDEEITVLSNSYLEVRDGEVLCRFNNTGYLEIAINRGPAASLLGLKLARDKHLIYNTIKISFG